MKNLTPEQQAVIVKIDEQMRQALQGYVGDPITDEKLGLMKRAIETVLDPIEEAGDRFSDHVRFVFNEDDLKHNVLHVHMVPDPVAPKWVYEIFEQLTYALRSTT